MCAHVFRLLARRPVPWVLLENVPGLLCWHMKDDPPQPPAMAHIASELERLGYRWAQRVVGLTGFGIPQRRRRVFILASKVGDPRDVLLAPQAVCLGQCLDLNRRRHRSEDIDEEEARREEDDAADEDVNVGRDGLLTPAKVAEGPACVECATARFSHPFADVGVHPPPSAPAGSSSRSSCSHPPRECYDCFHTPPFAPPKRTIACVDLAEKRHGPMLNELFTMTTGNAKRLALVEDLGAGKGRARMLRCSDAERLMGFPAGWTEPCYPLNLPGRPNRWLDRASLTHLPGFDTDASASRRLSLLGIAVAVPQARWIGERLANLYDLKFSRAGDGIRFKWPIPGGPNAAIGGVQKPDPRRPSGGAIVSEVQREEQAAASGWPECAWNNLESEPFLGKVRGASTDGGALQSDPTDGRWRGRRALRQCGDAPVIRGFVPLGEFLRDFEDAPEVDKEQAAGYVERLEAAHDRIEPFVANGLGVTRELGKKKENILMREGDGGSLEGEGERDGDEEDAAAENNAEGDGDPASSRKAPPSIPEKPPSRATVGPEVEAPVASARVGRAVLAHAESPNAPAAGSDGSDEEEFAGRLVWAPTKLRGSATPQFWPGLLLRLDEDRDLIPDAAIADSARVRAIDFSPSTHGLVVYFGDSTYEWRLIDDLLAYGEHADHLGSARGQPGLFGRVRFRKALDEAERWFEAQRKNRETPAAKAAKAARAKAEAALFRAVGATVAGDAESNPPPPCGLCRVCVSARRTQTVIPFSSRHKSRACAKPSTLAPIRGVRADDACPQIEIVLAARQGHVGANVALLGAKAIGRKVRCEWANERRCFEATVVGFDQETHTHRLEYDDGDVEPSARLWREHVHLAVPEDQKADAERRREKNDEAGARVEERGGGEARGGNAPREEAPRDSDSHRRAFEDTNDDDRAVDAAVTGGHGVDTGATGAMDARKAAERARGPDRPPKRKHAPRGNDGPGGANKRAANGGGVAPEGAAEPEGTSELAGAPAPEEATAPERSRRRTRASAA